MLAAFFLPSSILERGSQIAAKHLSISSNEHSVATQFDLTALYLKLTCTILNMIVENRMICTHCQASEYPMATKQLSHKAQSVHNMYPACKFPLTQCEMAWTLLNIVEKRVSYTLNVQASTKWEKWVHWL